MRQVNKQGETSVGIGISYPRGPKLSVARTPLHSRYGVTKSLSIDGHSSHHSLAKSGEDSFRVYAVPPEETVAK